MSIAEIGQQSVTLFNRRMPIYGFSPDHMQPSGLTNEQCTTINNFLDRLNADWVRTDDFEQAQVDPQVEYRNPADPCFIYAHLSNKVNFTVKKKLFSQLQDQTVLDLFSPNSPHHVRVDWVHPTRGENLAHFVIQTITKPTYPINEFNMYKAALTLGKLKLFGVNMRLQNIHSQTPLDIYLHRKDLVQYEQNESKTTGTKIIFELLST